MAALDHGRVRLIDSSREALIALVELDDSYKPVLDAFLAINSDKMSASERTEKRRQDSIFKVKSPTAGTHASLDFTDLGFFKMCERLNDFVSNDCVTQFMSGNVYDTIVVDRREMDLLIFRLQRYEPIQRREIILQLDNDFRRASVIYAQLIVRPRYDGRDIVEKYSATYGFWMCSEMRELVRRHILEAAIKECPEIERVRHEVHKLRDCPADQIAVNVKALRRFTRTYMSLVTEQFKESMCNAMRIVGEKIELSLTSEAKASRLKMIINEIHQSQKIWAPMNEADVDIICAAIFKGAELYVDERIIISVVEDTISDLATRAVTHVMRILRLTGRDLCDESNHEPVTLERIAQIIEGPLDPNRFKYTALICKKIHKHEVVCNAFSDEDAPFAVCALQCVAVSYVNAHSAEFKDNVDEVVTASVEYALRVLHLAIEPVSPAADSTI